MGRRAARLLSAFAVLGALIVPALAIESAQANTIPKLMFGMGDEVSSAETTPLYEAAPLGMATSWMNNQGDAEGWMTGLGPQLQSIYDGGKANELVVDLDNSQTGYALSGDCQNCYSAGGSQGNGFLYDIKRLTTVFEGSNPSVDHLYIVLFTEWDTYEPGNTAYETSLMQSYLNAVTAIHGIDPDAKVALGLGGYNWSSSPSATTDLSMVTSAINASDFVAVQAMQECTNEEQLENEVQASIAQLSSFKKPIMVSYMKLWGNGDASPYTCETSAMSTFEAHIFNDATLSVLTSEGLFAWGFMDDNYINTPGPSLTAAESDVDRYNSGTDVGLPVTTTTTTTTGPPTTTTTTEPPTTTTTEPPTTTTTTGPPTTTTTTGPPTTTTTTEPPTTTTTTGPPTTTTTTTTGPPTTTTTTTTGPPTTTTTTTTGPPTTTTTTGPPTTTTTTGPPTTTTTGPPTTTTTTTTTTTEPPTAKTAPTPPKSTSEPSPLQPFLPPPLLRPLGLGYTLVGADGGAFTFSGSPFYGSTGGLRLNQPIVGMAETSDRGGYWLIARDGGVFNFGDARFDGAVPAVASVNDVVGMAESDQGGYWVATADGRIFSFGGASTQPSLASLGVHINNVVGIVADPDADGFYLVASDGGVYAFGKATFRGSLGGRRLNEPVVGMAVDRVTDGYWLVAADGGIFAFHAPFKGSTGSLRLNRPIVAMAPTSDGGGYWFVASDGGVFAEGDAIFGGSLPSIGVAPRSPVVAMTTG